MLYEVITLGRAAGRVAHGSLVDMSLDLDLGIDLAHRARGIDEHGGSNDAHARLAIHHLLAPA